jgi:hypothetical protein
MTLNRGNGGEPASLDPHFIDLTLEANIVGDLLVGLVTEDRCRQSHSGRGRELGDLDRTGSPGRSICAAICGPTACR